MDNSKDKKEYELSFLIKEEGSAAAIVEMVKGLEAEIKNDGSVQKIHLAYPVDKQTEAFFGFIQFMLDPGKAKDIENNLRLDKRVMRSLLITPPPMKEKRRPGMEPQSRPTQPPREPRAVPLSNEALEKKIEEILQ